MNYDFCPFLDAKQEPTGSLPLPLFLLIHGRSAFLVHDAIL